MLYTIASFLKKVAGLVGKISGKDYEVQDIKIYFTATKPGDRSKQNYTLEKDKAKDGNFAYVAYELLFSSIEDTPKYYLYQVQLNSNGTARQGSDKVFDSASNGLIKDKSAPTKELTPEEVIVAFPEILKGPNLDPKKYGQVTFTQIEEPPAPAPEAPKAPAPPVNPALQSVKSPAAPVNPALQSVKAKNVYALKGKEYSYEDFKSLFDNNFYVVTDPKSNKLKNPFNRLIGLKGEK